MSFSLRDGGVTAKGYGGLMSVLERYFHPDFVDPALQHHRTGHAGYYGELIWVMVMLELWLGSRGR